MDFPLQGLKLNFEHELLLPPAHLQWLATCLAPEPQKRFASAAQALFKLKNLRNVLHEHIQDHFWDIDIRTQENALQVDFPSSRKLRAPARSDWLTLGWTTLFMLTVFPGFTLFNTYRLVFLGLLFAFPFVGVLAPALRLFNPLKARYYSLNLTSDHTLLQLKNDGGDILKTRELAHGDYAVLYKLRPGQTHGKMVLMYRAPLPWKKDRYKSRVLHPFLHKAELEVLSITLNSKRRVLLNTTAHTLRISGASD